MLILAFCIREGARGGLSATSGMWQAVKAGSPAISGGSLSCCWRFLSFLNVQPTVLQEAGAQQPGEGDSTQSQQYNPK